MSTHWDKFKFELRFDAAELQTEIINIEAYRLSLNKLILPQEWIKDLQHLHIIRSVHGTTAIEGNPLSQEEVSRQLLRKPAHRNTDQMHRQTANAAKAFRWVEEHFKKTRPITVQDIITVHELLTVGSDESDNAPGKFRRPGHNVTVGSPELGGVHRASPGGEVTQRLVHEFVRFINSRQFEAQHVVVAALTAHFYFVTLHPFGNGNGRTTRCIEAAILYGGGYNTYGFYSLSNFFYRNRDEYFRILQKTRTANRFSLTEFLSFGLRGFREELEKINAYVRNRTHHLQYRELVRRCSDQRVGKKRRLLNDREAKLLHRLLDLSKPADPFSDETPQKITSMEIKKICTELYGNRTPRTLTRELQRLRDLGFVQYERRIEEGDVRVLINLEAISRY